MHLELLNYFLAFLEGLALIVSPCILPILPIMLAGTIEGSKKRPLGIIVGFVVTFALFTLFSHFLVVSLGINLNHLRDIAFILIVLFGVVMVSEYLTERFGLLTQKLADIGTHMTSSNRKAEGFLSGLILGSLVSLVWTPCAGPILAAALIQIAVQKTTLSSFLALLAFALGSAVPMLLIALLGKKLLNSVGFIKKRTALLRKIFGMIIIVTTVTLAYISHFRPDLFAKLASSPSSATLGTSTLSSANKSAVISPTMSLANGLAKPYLAPEFSGIDLWINSNPLTLAELKGKVVLIDFWTYSCINCIRTLPYLLAWDKNYGKQGLVIVGVHTPEFEFEKNPDNVRQAVARFGIHYPVALDNQYATWNNFQNSYWPAHYLIDKKGRVVYQHFGEGEYAETEHNIRVLLGLNSMMNLATGKVNALVPSDQLTPETYFGYERMENFTRSKSPVINQSANYTFSQQLPLNAWSLNGSWRIEGQKIIATSSGAAIKIHFQANHVYAVMGNTTNGTIKVKVLLNGQPVGTYAGTDVHNNEVIVTGHRLYEVARFSKNTTGEITLIVDNPGLALYTFTFG